MTAKTLDKKRLPEFAKAILAGGYHLFAPVRSDNQVTLAEVGQDSEFDLNYRNFKMSPKEFFLPQSEVLCRFCRGEIVEDGGTPADEKRVLLGVRPCDARAFWLVDKVFLDEPEDVYYKRNRDKTIVITAACTDPESTCFCTSVGCGPAAAEGSDVMLFDLGEKLLLEPVTDRGGEFVEQFSKLTKDATKKEVGAKEKIADEAASRMEKLSLEDVAKRLADAFESDIWTAYSQKCLGCGVCTYFCPTCHCFDVTDETHRENGQRIRTWDSCMYKLFTLHGSGHNPRPGQNERVRQRFMHKFSYAVDNNGELFCVGCGRCIKHCPVNIDVREVIVP